MPSKVRRNISGQMGAKDCCNRRLESASIPVILHLFGQGNLTFIREKSGKSQGILKTDVCGNHVLASVNTDQSKYKNWEGELSSTVLAFRLTTTPPLTVLAF